MKKKPLIALVVASVIVVALAYEVQLAIRPAPTFRGYTHIFRMLLKGGGLMFGELTERLRLAEEHNGLIPTTLEMSYRSFATDRNEQVTLEMGFAAWIFKEVQPGEMPHTIPVGDVEWREIGVKPRENLTCFSRTLDLGDTERPVLWVWSVMLRIQLRLSDGSQWVFDERKEESQLKGINPLNADEGFKCPPSVLGWKLAELNGREEVDSFEVALYMISS